MLLVVIVAGLFGLIFGSAINAMVWRLYVGRSWVHGRSVCPECEHVLAAIDLVPVISWLVLRGRCRYCRQPIKDHPVVEVITGVVFALSAARLMGDSWQAMLIQIVWLVVAIMLIVLAVYDARWLLLPDKVMLPLIVVSFGYGVMMSVLDKSRPELIGYLAAAIMAGGAFYSLVFFSRGRAMGGGDIKLAFAMGLILGWPKILVALFFAFNVAAIVGLVMLMMKKKKTRDQIPFGPYLVGATILAQLYGEAIIRWYLRLSGIAA